MTEKNDASFPPRFLWGCATSAYQIEGAARADGRGESIWDRFCDTPGNVEDGSSGIEACDHFHRFRDDIALMRDLNLAAYRFSIAWPRVIPAGRGQVNPAGLAFYDRLVDTLLEAGIEPYATLFHWDLPQVLQDEGGWTVRATAEAFAEYAATLGRHFRGRVRHWITQNEPWCISHLGHRIGRHAPGQKSWSAALTAAHHVLLAHGLGMRALRACDPRAEVGIALNLTPVHAASDSDADAAATRLFDGEFNRWFLDPLFGRGYPADTAAEFAARGFLPAHWQDIVRDGDLALIASPIDFLGVNYYNRTVMRSEDIPEAQNLPRTTVLAPSSEWTDMGWEVYPEGLYEILCRVQREYSPPRIFITENGASFSTGPGADGRIRDSQRVRFLRDHLDAALRAIRSGVRLEGYFVWSLLDNFEWERGYQQRFGIVWVDYATQRRVPKDSARWYARVAAANALVAEET
jgi:beta-glucosidase